MWRRSLALTAAACALAACASTPESDKAAQSYIYEPGRSARAEPFDPQVITNQKIGRPYQIEGRWYVPARQDNYDATGTASWYGPQFHGRPTANGERFDMNALTAAHPTLPLPSYVRVTNLGNGRSAIVRVNDRGPFARDRIIDLSKRSAQVLGFVNQGTAEVRVQYLGPKENELGQPALYTAALEKGRSALRADFVPAGDQAQDLTPSSLFIQAGAFSQSRRAQRTLQSLAQVGPGNIESVSVAGRKLHRVLIGPFVGSDEAEQARYQVAAAGFEDARIVRRN